MRSMLDVFIRDAQDDLRKLSAALPKAPGDLDALREVQRLARRFAYNARLAQQKDFAAVGDLIYETASGALAGTHGWTAETSHDVSEAVTGLHTLVQVAKNPPVDFEHRIRSLAQRMRVRLGLEPAPGAETAAPQPPAAKPPVAGPPAASPPAAGPVAAGPVAAGPPLPVPEAPVAPPSRASLADLVAQLRDAVARLERDPRDREPLKAVLRKVRPLRNAPDFPEIPAVDTALSAVEDIILTIADQNATVGPAHLALFARAREALEAATRALEEDATLGAVARHEEEIKRLKSRILETARRQRPVIWVTELFFDDAGPHIVACPRADAAPGGAEGFFRTEALARLDAAEELRKKMANADAESARLAGESLSSTLRMLRERAVAFGHREFGRIARRAAAAVRAQLVRPPDQLRGLAAALEEPLRRLRDYGSASDPEDRSRALREADAALEWAIVGGPEAAAAGEAAPPEPLDPDAALRRALSLRTRIDERLRAWSAPEAAELRKLLDEMFDALSTYLSATAPQA
jgi:hypothetical protein